MTVNRGTDKMLYKEFLLKEIEPSLQSSNAILRIYISSRNEAVSLRPGMLVLPGGGYSMCSPREAEPIAFRFLAEGFNCFILDYSPYQKYPVPHLEVAAAMNYIRKHEVEFDLIKDSLSIIGFSAGGHLAASYSYLFRELVDQLCFDPEFIKPRATLLGYPVTLMNEKTHQGTKEIITGLEPELIRKLDVPSHITIEYPPTFVWATKDDEMVPVENSIELAKALERNHVKHKCIIYESGRHGLSLDNRSVYLKSDITEKMKNVRDWASQAADFVFEVTDNEN